MHGRKAAQLISVSLLLVVALGATGVLATAGDESRPRLMPQLGHDKRLASVAFSPDGKQILTGGDDSTAVLWDVASGREVRRFGGYSTDIDDVAFVNDGKQALLATGGIYLVDLSTGEQFDHVGGRRAPMAVSPDGKQLLSRDDDINPDEGDGAYRAALWNPSTRTKLTTFERHKGGVQAVAFSPNGKLVASGRYFVTSDWEQPYPIVLWELATGKKVRELTGHPAAGEVRRLP